MGEVRECFLEEVALAPRAEGCSGMARQRGGITFQAEDTTHGKGLRSREKISVSRASLERGRISWG